MARRSPKTSWIGSDSTSLLGCIVNGKIRLLIRMHQKPARQVDLTCRTHSKSWGISLLVMCSAIHLIIFQNQNVKNLQFSIQLGGDSSPEFTENWMDWFILDMFNLKHRYKIVSHSDQYIRNLPDNLPDRAGFECILIHTVI